VPAAYRAEGCPPLQPCAVAARSGMMETHRTSGAATLMRPQKEDTDVATTQGADATCRRDRAVDGAGMAHQTRKRVASFVNRPPLLQSWEKTETCAAVPQERTAHKTQRSRAVYLALYHGVARIGLTAPLSYNVVAVHLGPCKKRLHDVKTRTQFASRRDVAR
jgi:hypothetical protein